MLPLLLAANACQAHDPTPAATGGPLIAYTLPKSTPWFQAGDVSFVLAQGKTPIKTWTKHMDASRLGGLTSPAFTTDGKYAFAQYADEEAGRYPYDGGDIRAQLVWVDIASRQIHEAAIPARSRTSSHQPGRPGSPYALNGSTVVWQGPAAPDAPDGQVTLMQLDLAQPNAAPSILRTVQLPPRTPEQRAQPSSYQDFTGNVIGAGHGRVAIAKKYDADDLTQADRLFLVDADGTVRDLGHMPTTQWISVIFSPDGTRFAYETGKNSPPSPCAEHQITVFDSATGHPAINFPPGPVAATPRPSFYGNTNGAAWWTADGRLRATAGADTCPTNPSEVTADSGVWELSGSQWTQVDPPGTYRDYPLPNGEAVVVAKPSQSPGQSSTATGLFIRQNGQLVHVADVEATAVAVA
ncbi:hypothetical protein BOO86_13690 [Mycobacterium sp. CBMA 234]|nr:hypothetical protein [Mycolicibacterium sp. CBMA 234]